jgi:uncharacterized protein
MIRRKFGPVVLVAAIGGAPLSAQVTASAVQDDTVRLVIASDTLIGSLMRPVASTPARTTLVVLHPGSGPTSRDGNSPGVGANNNLRQLAESLSAHGIASLRIDKRGIWSSARALRTPATLVVQDYVTDAAAWVSLVRGMGYRKVVFAGHSEGALIGTMATARSRIDALVLLSGAGRRADLLLHAQVAAQAPAPIVAAMDSLLTALRTTDGPVIVPPVLVSSFPPPVHAYLRSWFRLDPAKELASVAVPVLIMQGLTDLQVGEQDARALSAALPSAQLVLLSGVNHMLREVSGPLANQLASYTSASLPVSGRVVESLVTFVRGVQ